MDTSAHNLLTSVLTEPVAVLDPKNPFDWFFPSLSLLFLVILVSIGAMPHVGPYHVYIYWTPSPSLAGSPHDLRRKAAYHILLFSFH
jgi:hypothetical protein